MHLSSNTGLRSRAKFIMGGASILAAVGYLFFSSTKANAEYFMHVEQLTARDAGLLGQNPRISRVVVGKTMQFNPDIHNLSFDFANFPGDNTMTCIRTANR
jgi:cytochrome c-type biogenesis protein CcmE